MFTNDKLKKMKTKKNIIEIDLHDFTNFMFGANRNLNQITRFPTRQRSYDEKVASHIYWVSLYSLIMVDLLKKNGIKVDSEKTLRYALVHDIEETISGDVARTAKKEMPELFSKLTDISAKISLECLPDELRKDYLKKLKHNNSLEFKIVKIADELSGIVYAAEQVKLGNQFFHSILEGYLQNLEKTVKNTPFEPLHTWITTMIRNYHLHDYDTYAKKN